MRPTAGGPSHPAQDLARSCRTVDASRHRPAIGCGHRGRGRRCVRSGRAPAPSRLHADWHAERSEREHVAPPVRGLPAGLEGVAAPGRSQPGRRERFPGGGGLRERNHAAAPAAGCRLRRKLSDGGRVHAGAAAVSDPLPRGHRARDVRRSPLAGCIRAAVDDDQSSQVRDRPPRRGAAGRSNRAGGRRETQRREGHHAQDGPSDQGIVRVRASRDAPLRAGRRTCRRRNRSRSRRRTPRVHSVAIHSVRRRRCP